MEVGKGSEAQQASGRRWVLAVIIGTLALSLAVIAMSGLGLQRGTNPIGQVVRFGFEVGLCIALYQRANWARWIMGILFAMAGVVGVMVSARPGGRGALVLAGMGLFYIGCVVVLFGVPSVRAYFHSARDEPDN